MNSTVSRTLEVCLVSILFSLATAPSALADTINLAWDPDAEQIGGYKVHVGTQSGNYTQHLDVGLATSYTYSTAVAGQRYCFAVSAYSTSFLEGPKSNEVCGYSDTPPTLQNPGNQSSPVGQNISLQLVASDPDSQPLTFSATGLPPGLSIMASTGLISGAGTTAGTYSVTARASDGTLSASQSFTWTVTGGGSGSDTTPPTVTITSPTSASTYTTTSSTIALGGTAADSSGVQIVGWINDRGGSAVANGTDTWSVPSITLASGTNTITVKAQDGAGNIGSDVITVTVSTSGPPPPPPSGDTTPPTVTITSPTTNSSYVTSAFSVTLGGTSADNVGVTQVMWANNRGGSGMASGTTSWTTGAIVLKGGMNVLTITVSDPAGNVATDKVTVYRRQ